MVLQTQKYQSAHCGATPGPCPCVEMGDQRGKRLPAQGRGEIAVEDPWTCRCLKTWQIITPNKNKKMLMCYFSGVLHVFQNCQTNPAHSSQVQNLGKQASVTGGWEVLQLKPWFLPCMVSTMKSIRCPANCPLNLNPSKCHRLATERSCSTKIPSGNDWHSYWTWPIYSWCAY